MSFCTYPATIVCAAQVFFGTAVFAQTAEQKARAAMVTLLSPAIVSTPIGSQIGGGWNVFRATGDGGMVWHDANTAESILAYYEATKDATFNPTVEAYYGDNILEPLAGQTNTYNDDDLWWALTFVRAYDDGLTSQSGATKSWYLGEAQTIFNHVCTQWKSNWNASPENPHGCPGVPQTNNGSYVNSITSELLFQLAAKLALRVPDNSGCSSGTAPLGLPDTYAGWAEYQYMWFQQYYASTLGYSPIPDGLDNNCTPTGTAWTYNQGPILGALLDMSTLASTNSSVNLWLQQYGSVQSATLSEAFRIAQVAMQTFQQPAQAAVLTELNDFGSADGCLNLSGDCPAFKGIFMRHLSHLLANTNITVPGYVDFYNAAAPLINASASSIWQHQAGYPSSPLYLPEKWTATQIVPNLPHQGGDPQTSQTSAIDGLVAAMIVPAPPPVTPPPPPPPAPGCTPTATCSSEYFPPGYGSPSEQTIDTITLTCKNAQTTLQELIGSAWVGLANFAPNAGYPAFPSEVYKIQGPVGSVQSVRACAISSGSICDAPASVTVANCCVPLTCAGSCGTMSDGCGGTLQCSGCTGGLLCSNYNVCEKCAITRTCGAGFYFDENTCECAKDFCSCGGEYPKCTICR